MTFSKSGCGSAWLEHLLWEQGVAGSNPVTPTIFMFISAGVVQWQNTSLPSQIRGFDSHHPLDNFCHICVRSSVGQSNGLLSRGSGVRIPSSTLDILISRIFGSAWWVQRSWLARQIVALKAEGSNPSIHPFFQKVSKWHAWCHVQGYRQAVRYSTLTAAVAGSNPASPAIYGILAQSVEHLTFNQVVRGSNPRCLINKNRHSKEWRFFLL